MTDYSACFWHGKPFPELERDELYEIIVHLAAGTEELKRCHDAELNKLRGTIFSMQLTDRLFKAYPVKGQSESIN